MAKAKVMNPTLKLLLNRKSVRAYEDCELSREVKDAVITAALRAPTAGNMMLYSIIEVQDQSLKDALAETCDHQPFIAKAPFVLLFLADYQRWTDYFQASGVEALCAEQGVTMRKPQEGDLFLACCDALIAAQTAVIAAESLGLGSCYIGDIMEHYEEHKALFGLPQYTFPISLVCFGYPTPQQREREQPGRFSKRVVVFEDRYTRFEPERLEVLFRERQERVFGEREEVQGARNLGQLMYTRKFNAEFTHEMTRSVKAMLQAWLEE
ncbi:MAG: nitroreductase family protein [Anaerolineae bacterium]|jgi:FMN reductase (NADPH)/FMN reductase [NAD(P)H]|nr:nitroreductase family protein [Anaerolineae bacterium]